MDQKTFNRVAAGVFGAIAALQAARVLARWDAEVAGRRIPLGASAVAAAAAGGLAAWALSLERTVRGVRAIGRRASSHRVVSSGPAVRR